MGVLDQDRAGSRFPEPDLHALTGSEDQADRDADEHGDQRGAGEPGDGPAAELDLEGFVEWQRSRIEAVSDAESAAAAVQAAPPEHLWHGLQRFLSSGA